MLLGKLLELAFQRTDLCVDLEGLLGPSIELFKSLLDFLIDEGFLIYKRHTLGVSISRFDLVLLKLIDLFVDVSVEVLSLCCRCLQLFHLVLDFLARKSAGRVESL